MATYKGFAWGGKDLPPNTLSASCSMLSIIEVTEGLAEMMATFEQDIRLGPGADIELHCSKGLIYKFNPGFKWDICRKNSIKSQEHGHDGWPLPVLNDGRSLNGASIWPSNANHMTAAGSEKREFRSNGHRNGIQGDVHYVDRYVLHSQVPPLCLTALTTSGLGRNG